MNGEADHIDREKIEQNGWRQGAVCKLSSLQALLDKSDPAGCSLASADTLAILVTHDCDIVNTDLAKEPIVEWLVASRIQTTHSSCVYGKNSRKYHYKHNEFCYEALAHKRFSTRRNVLEILIAEESLNLSFGKTSSLQNGSQSATSALLSRMLSTKGLSKLETKRAGR